MNMNFYALLIVCYPKAFLSDRDTVNTSARPYAMLSPPKQLGGIQPNLGVQEQNYFSVRRSVCP